MDGATGASVGGLDEIYDDVPPATARLRGWPLVGSLACVVCACTNSALLTRRHLRTAGPRAVRAATVRILLMVPLYSVESFLALVCGASEFNNVLVVLRKGYECLVVLAFAELLLVWLGGLEALIDRLEPQCCRHLPPLSFVLPTWAPAVRFVRRTLTGVLQYVPCSLLATAVFLASWLGAARAPLTLRRLQVVSMVVMNASQACAVYCLLTFYAANRGLLTPFRPIQKMLAVKAIFFLSFWQEMAVRTAEHRGLFEGWQSALVQDWTGPQVAGAVLNGLICVEMLVLSLVHPYIFPPGEAARLGQPCAAAAQQTTPVAPSPAGCCVSLDDESDLSVAAARDEAHCSRRLEVCSRFLAALDLSDVPGFMRSIRGLHHDNSHDAVAVGKRQDDADDAGAGARQPGGQDGGAALKVVPSSSRTRYSLQAQKRRRTSELFVI